MYMYYIFVSYWLIFLHVAVNQSNKVACHSLISIRCTVLIIDLRNRLKSL